ncbi:MAG: hypothetical protein JSW58_12325 [Candidatus Latescibacterota bacterium]|nr:MAG: hypothetical protein JSW58_12325 [Candidatus Latescibacterota bacterium]
MRKARNAPSDLGGKKKKRMADSPVPVSRTTTRPRFGTFVFAALALTILAVPVSRAQEINEAVTIEDLGFTGRFTVGARPSALAGAYTAAGEDIYSLVYNPAGLARIRRIETSLGFQHKKNNLTNVFYGNDNEVDLSSTRLDAFAAAYPVPTYRGSLVFAGGVYRVMSSDFQILNRGFNTVSETFDDYLLQQTGSIYSYNVGFGVDLSPAISAGASGFMMDGTIKALTQFSYAYPPPFVPGEQESEFLLDDARVDLDGYGATIGIQYHPLSLVRFGLSVTTPIKINLSGDAIEETARYFFNAPGEFTSQRFAIDTDYKIPFRINVGFALSTPNVLFAADVGYTDWAQAEINSRQLKDEDLRPIFNQVIDIRAGAELVLPFMPVRVRAGYAYLPYGLEYLQADRIAGNALTKAEVQTQRQIYAAGCGFLLGRVLIIDAAYEYSLGKRSIGTLVDDRTSHRLILTGSYRF